MHQTLHRLTPVILPTPWLVLLLFWSWLVLSVEEIVVAVERGWSLHQRRRERFGVFDGSAGFDRDHGRVDAADRESSPDPGGDFVGGVGAV